MAHFTEMTHIYDQMFEKMFSRKLLKLKGIDGIHPTAWDLIKNIVICGVYFDDK